MLNADESNQHYQGSGAGKHTVSADDMHCKQEDVKTSSSGAGSTLGQLLVRHNDMSMALPITSCQSPQVSNQVLWDGYSPVCS